MVDAPLTPATGLPGRLRRPRGVLLLCIMWLPLVAWVMFGNAIHVIQAATLVGVGVAVFSRIISDVGYTVLNPRIRFG